uniref:probable WRKY transcription factor 53 n=1 Tax=Erigeron canadensis TaxID=72917 RepID=UPI001CB98049|nr:probable WRKY transcription factor 53 [Erigeron canadensis]XP_043628974.1 probable WRKY transcription factor 53 [Erigeron canadensis]
MDIINELTQGMELAKELKSILSSECPIERKLVLIQEIISSYDRALLIVNWGHSADKTPPLVQPMLSQPESSVSIDESPRSGDITNQTFDNQQDQKAVSKKRKTMPTWKNQIRISTENGLEGNTDDHYSWRKYGQKDILGAKFPRSYYRCTYRYVHNCMARKQVQRTDEDTTVFEITYRGEHTCNPATMPSVAPPQSPEKHEMKQTNQHHNYQLPLPIPPKSGEMLSNLRENLRVSTSDLEATISSSFSFPSASFGSVENYQQFQFSNETDNSFLQGYSPSGSNYFTEWGYDFQHHDDSNLSGMISTTTSATNSPLAFPADPQDISLNFPFSNSGHFL